MNRSLEMRTRLYGDGLVDDITLNPRRGCQAHLEAAHTAHDAAMNNHIIGNQFALHGGAFANGQQMRADVALDLALNHHITGGLKVTFDMKVGGEC